MSLATITRTYDVSAFRGQRPTGVVLLSASLAGSGDPGELITGALKVAQWFAIELLTESGSLPYDPSRGTGFVTALNAGQIRTETDVFVAFGLAVGDLQAAATLVEPDGTPDDERFAGAVLDSAVISPGQARLNITISTAAGTSRPVILPIATFV